MPRAIPHLADTFVRQAKHSGGPGDDKHRDGGSHLPLFLPERGLSGRQCVKGLPARP